mmetsp:Transcript_10954/g.16938  ORF Transcript_10954/g.16938 Transcript_10954/m.16938 type:complete len:82 (+) Transcript_10954:3-248(+)
MPVSPSVHWRRSGRAWCAQKPGFVHRDTRHALLDLQVGSEGRNKGSTSRGSELRCIPMRISGGAPEQCAQPAGNGKQWTRG